MNPDHFDFDAAARELASDADLNLSPEELQAQLSAAVEQHKMGNRELGKLAADYYKTLRVEGLDEETARMLTAQLHGSMLNQAMNVGLLRLAATIGSDDED